MPIEDIIFFIITGMISIGCMVHLVIKKRDLELKVIAYEDYIKQLKIRLHNKK